MALALSLSPASDVPIFKQIVQQVRRSIVLGHIDVGEQLPAVRSLAETLVINPNTVARAYQDMIRDGILESRQGRGVFVAEKRQIFSDDERQRRLGQAAEQLCHEAVMLGYELPEIRETVAVKWKEMTARNLESQRKMK